jgi:hypothetical protein
MDFWVLFSDHDIFVIYMLSKHTTVRKNTLSTHLMIENYYLQFTSVEQKKIKDNINYVFKNFM